MGFEMGLRGDWKKLVWIMITTFALEIKTNCCVVHCCEAYPEVESFRFFKDFASYHQYIWASTIPYVA